MFVEQRLVCSTPVSTFSFDVQFVRVQTIAEDACETLLKISGLFNILSAYEKQVHGAGHCRFSARRKEGRKEKHVSDRVLTVCKKKEIGIVTSTSLTLDHGTASQM